MKTILGQLLNDLQSPDGVAEELYPGLWRMLRWPAFPPEVWKLDWGRPGPPDYLRYTDHWYTKRNSYRGIQWDLIAYTSSVPWWHFEHLRRPGDPADDSRCCFQCGRRLAYRTKTGSEHCATCQPLTLPQIIRGEFSLNAGENFEPIEEAPNLTNVTFFLRPGVGLDWIAGKPAEWGADEQTKA